MKSIIIFITAILSCGVCSAQADSTTNIAAESTPAKSTFTVGTVYANNASYYGQKSQERTPYAAVAATYRFKSGFYFSGLAYKLLHEKTSSISSSSLGAGINLKLSKKVSADVSYNHSFFSAYSPLLQAGNPDNASLNLTFENWVTVNLTGDYAFGKTSDGFVTGGISKSVNLFSLTPKDILTITPSADVAGGTQHFYQTYMEEKKLRDSVLGGILSPITGDPSSGGTNKTVSTTAFDILSYNFKLPLAYNRSKYVIEANYQLSILTSKVDNSAGKTNSFITFSFYYQF